ncbi:hypothetical protein KP509_11G015300 [Ceratopteris richardii]|nr:hypothetical protein KP509_11G015300 [Ceratopteris richardii]
MVLLEKNMDSSNINHDEDNQSSGHFLQDTISAPAKQNGENESSIEKKSDTFSPTNDANVNGSMSVLVKSDILNKMHSSLTNLSRVHLRQEPGDGPYNYASDLKGAKILASNQEAKGASNILNRDRDKYFRTPCSIESKYVDMELAEETLVVEIILANHEFYSSNVREFAVWGSLIYPTDEWILLGKFEAENSRVSQVFILKEPQWVRYMKLQMLSHYGTDFYCTLSTLEVHGVDAIEWILEDWIAEELGESHSQSSSIKDEDSSHVDKDLVSLSSTQTHVISQDSKPEEEIDIMLNQNLEDCSVESSVDVPEKKSKPMEKSQPVYHQTGRPGLDAVMKLLMQKVRTLEQKQPSLSRSLNDLDIQQREIFKAHSDEVTMMMSKVEDQGFEIGNLSLLLQSMERQWKRERDTLEGDVLNRIQAWNMDFESLRACGSPMLAVWLNVKP